MKITSTRRKHVKEEQRDGEIFLDERAFLSEDKEAHNVSLFHDENTDFGLPDRSNVEDIGLQSLTPRRVVVGSADGSRSRLYSDPADAERGTGSGSLLVEKRAIANRSQGRRDSAKQGKTMKRGAGTAVGSSSLVHEKRAIAIRSEGTTDTAKWRKKRNQTAGTAIRGGGVLDEKRAIADRSEGIMLSVKQRKDPSQDSDAAGVISMEASKGRHRRHEGSPAARPDISNRAPVSQSTTARGRSLRAQRPGAFEVLGQTLGAPGRLDYLDHQNAEDSEQHNSNSRNTGDTEQQDVEAEVASVLQYLEAVPVGDHESQIVYAETATFGIKYMLRERSGRRLLACICLVILLVGVVVGGTVALLKGSNGPQAPQLVAVTPMQIVNSIEAPTGAPTSAAPSLINSEIEQAAESVSGVFNGLSPASPQRRAVGWMSTWDTFDTQGQVVLFNERYILTLFYYALNGERWLQQELWLTPKLHVCKWSTGIRCAKDRMQREVVTGIQLEGNGLSGTVPRELSLIASLTSVKLPRNTINGPFSSALTNVTTLTLLDLSFNRLTGTIPRFGKNLSLQFLQLNNNAFTGTLPPSIYDLFFLIELDISHNNITGTLSENIDNLTSLAILNVEENDLYGPLPSVTKLTSLYSYQTGFNRFITSVPLAPTLIVKPTAAPSIIVPVAAPATAAPSLIRNDIETAAETLSGADIVLTPDSPQRRAVGWLSTFDRFDTQGFGLIFTQRYVLTLFYYALNGEKWSQQESWLSPTLHVCHWSVGIICGTDPSQRLFVTGIQFTRNGLSGTIPNELVYIDSLTILQLAQNAINGTVPEALTKIASLTLVDLSVNHLNGTIPSDIGNMVNLIYLVLNSNALTGTIPESMYDLTLLKKLDVSQNSFTGTFSKNITKLTSLDTLNVQHNRIYGPVPSLDGLATLDFVHLDYNQFSGPAPSLGSQIIGRLEYTFSHNLITGELPQGQNLSQLENIPLRVQRVDFSYNRLTGSITPLLALVPTVQYLDLSGNSFTGLIPAQADVASWQSLQYFGAANNQFTGTIPLGFSTALTALDLSGNRLTRGIPNEIYINFPNLAFLNLGNNPLGGSISRVLGALLTLQDLRLSNCKLTGSLPPNLGALSSLGRIDVSDNEIDGTIPSSIGSLTLLMELELQNNRLTGSLPADLGSLNLVSALNVANNSLTGTLPSNLGHISILHEVDVSGNSFVGAFPEGVCSNPNFTSAIVDCGVNCSCCSHPAASNCQVGNVFVHHT